MIASLVTSRVDDVHEIVSILRHRLCATLLSPLPFNDITIAIAIATTTTTITIAITTFYLPRLDF